MTLADILGWTATVLFTACYWPQIMKTIKTKTVAGLSFRLLLISFIGNIIALWYALLIDQRPLQVKYVLALIFLAACIAMYLRVYFKVDKHETQSV
ncbi:MAG: PQ-loop repeat-containing protein [Candidatus Omnitrophica bacterium]|nr:PQ-loop repeat-containing protein [Candidatus Omnitrophota bacterium]